MIWLALAGGAASPTTETLNFVASVENTEVALAGILPPAKGNGVEGCRSVGKMESSEITFACNFRLADWKGGVPGTRGCVGSIFLGMIRTFRLSVFLCCFCGFV